MGAKLGRGKPNRPIIVKGAPSIVPGRLGAQPIVISTSSGRYRIPNCRRVVVGGYLPLATVKNPQPILVTQQPDRRFRRPPTATLIRNTRLGTSAAVPSGLAGVVSPSSKSGTTTPTSKTGTVGPTETKGGA